MTYQCYQLFVQVLLVEIVRGNNDLGEGGRLVTPTPRCGMWRVHPTCPTYNNDNKLSCSVNDANCRTCGNFDNELPPLPPEIGGQCDCAIEADKYHANTTMLLKVKVSEASGGSYQFKLCVRDLESRSSMSSNQLEQCLNSHILTDMDGATTFTVSEPGEYEHWIKIPHDINGNGSLLQWRYARDAQVNFYSCADIDVIGPSDMNAPSPSCRAADGPWKDVPGIDEWCHLNCNYEPAPFCPPSHCVCN